MQHRIAIAATGHITVDGDPIVGGRIHRHAVHHQCRDLAARSQRRRARHPRAVDQRQAGHLRERTLPWLGDSLIQRGDQFLARQVQHHQGIAEGQHRQGVFEGRVTGTETRPDAAAVDERRHRPIRLGCGRPHRVGDQIAQWHFLGAQARCPAAVEHHPCPPDYHLGESVHRRAVACDPRLDRRVFRRALPATVDHAAHEGAAAHEHRVGFPLLNDPAFVEVHLQPPQPAPPFVAADYQYRHTVGAGGHGRIGSLDPLALTGRDCFHRRWVAQQGVIVARHDEVDAAPTRRPFQVDRVARVGEQDDFVDARRAQAIGLRLHARHGIEKVDAGTRAGNRWDVFRHHAQNPEPLATPLQHHAGHEQSAQRRFGADINIGDDNRWARFLGGVDGTGNLHRLAAQRPTQFRRSSVEFVIAQGGGVVAQGVHRHDLGRAFPGVVEDRALEMVTGIDQQYVRFAVPDGVDQCLAAGDTALLRPLVARRQLVVARKRFQVAVGIVGVQQGQSDRARGGIAAKTGAAVQTRKVQRHSQRE